MSDKQICGLVRKFRRYIDTAKARDFFEGEIFDDFPKECCGDASCLLAEFLRENYIETIYVSGKREDEQTHAWLVVKDNRINIPSQQLLEAPGYVKTIWNSYRGCSDNTPIDITHYEEKDIQDGLFIDITGDQFEEPPVFVGYTNEFFQEFIFREAKDFEGLCDDRLIDLYQIIISMEK